jgi:hypothetical protein
MNEIDMKTLGTGERKILRRTHKPAIEQGIWRIRNIKGLRELYEDAAIVADIKNKSLEWIGHLERRD